MKKIKYYITSLLIGCMFACDSYIDVVPDGLATIELAFNSRVNAQGFLFTLYNYMPRVGRPDDNPAMFGGDEMWGLPQDVFNGNELDPALVGLQVSLGFQNTAAPLFDYITNQPHGVSNLFIALRDCNIFLENIHIPRDIDESERRRWIAEAKFLKAFYHFELLRMYGAIPTIDVNTDVSTGVEGVRFERDLADNTIAYIVSILDEAIQDLPSNITSPTTELGRVTKAAAASIKARILAWSASPLINGNTAYANWVNNAGEPYINQNFDANKWELATVACREAIALSVSGGHSLHQSDGNPLFPVSATTLTELSIRESLSEQWNTELIWGLFDHHSEEYQWHSYPYTDGATATRVQGAAVRCDYAPTLRIAELFYSDNGVPIEDDINYDYANRYSVSTATMDDAAYIEPGYTTANLHFNREPRFHASLFFDGGKVYGAGRFDDTDLFTFMGKKGQIGGQSGEDRYSITGYFPKKVVPILDVLNADGFDRAVNNYALPIVKLSDMYLLLAECSNEAFGPSQEVYDNLDIIRERAGLNGVVDSWTAHVAGGAGKVSNQDDLREIIHQERLIELVFEGHRFWDLRRWLKAQDMLNNSEIKGWNILGETTEDYYNIETIAITSFTQKNYFWPVSETDAIANPNFDQSPGW